MASVSMDEIKREALLRAGGRKSDPRVGARCEWCNVINYSVRSKDWGRPDWCIPSPKVVRSSYAEALEVKKYMREKHGQDWAIVKLQVEGAYIRDWKGAKNYMVLCQRCHNKRVKWLDSLETEEAISPFGVNALLTMGIIDGGARRMIERFTRILLAGWDDPHKNLPSIWGMLRESLEEVEEEINRRNIKEVLSSHEGLALQDEYTLCRDSASCLEDR